MSKIIAMAMADNSGHLIKVDPNVYIKCRLCVENTGRYQIMPAVQKQIQYCFDINVDHFDGLPQLLCETCKLLLDDYTAHKKKFIEKQENLLARFKPNNDDNAPPQEPPTDKQSENEREKISTSENLNTESLNSATIKRTIRNRLISDSSNESRECTKNKKRRKSQVNKGWKKKYITYFVCNLCSNKYKKRKQLLVHLYNIHSNLQAKHHKLLNKICSVKLNKVDSKINETGNTNTVMFNHDKIIQISKNPMYHVLYVSQNKKLNSNSSDISLKESLKRICSESSDDNFYANKKTRISKPLSRSSSNETVLIEGHNNKVPNVEIGKPESSETNPKKASNAIDMKDMPRNNDTECINIDDSSESDIDLNTDKRSHTASNKIECKTIDNIISVCKTKYIRKIESKVTNQSESLLKHKILSIGRKIINNHAKFNCAGILRYMLHKNLDIAWLPKRHTKTYGEGLIRIMTRLKFNEANNDNSGWSYLVEKINHIEPQISNSASKVSAITTSNPSNNTSISQFIFPAPVSTYQGPFLAIQGLNTCSVVPSPENTVEIETSKKILNETPVANPKPAPKKMTSSEVKLSDNKTPVFLQVVEEKSESRPPVFVQLVEDKNDQPDPCMPVITSTTSLAPMKNQDTKPDSTKEVEKNVPRIKVKSAYELLKPSNLFSTNDAWPGNAVENMVTTPLPDGVRGSFITTGNYIIPQFQNVENPPPDSTHNNIVDHIILDTIEFPNTKTHSPFKYLKSLLGLHNINLLEPNAPMANESVCLLKIKVHFKQENKSKVVMLCLSIFCYDGVFCIRIRDSNQVSIQMTKISANWQWEILKIFQGEVSNKILQNAEKAGPIVHSKTKTFITLLKSINCKSL